MIVPAQAKLARLRSEQDRLRSELAGVPSRGLGFARTAATEDSIRVQIARVEGAIAEAADRAEYEWARVRAARAERERREGMAHMEALAAQIEPLSPEDRARIDAADRARRRADAERHNRRQMSLRAKYPQHAERFRTR